MHTPEVNLNEINFSIYTKMNLLETDLQNNSEGKVEKYMKFYLKVTPSLQQSLYLK